MFLFYLYPTQQRAERSESYCDNIYGGVSTHWQCWSGTSYGNGIQGGESRMLSREGTGYARFGESR